MGCHFFLQGIFLTQRLNPHLLCLQHYRWILYPLGYQRFYLILLVFKNACHSYKHTDILFRTFLLSQSLMGRDSFPLTPVSKSPLSFEVSTVSFTVKEKKFSSALFCSMPGGLWIKLIGNRLTGEKAHNFYEYLHTQKFTEKRNWKSDWSLGSHLPF